MHGSDLTGCFLDYEKAFDLLPLHEILLPLAARLGLPRALTNCLSNLYLRFERVVKFSKGFGANPLTADRGIVQGCPVSVVLLNLLGMVFLKTIDSRCPSTCPRVYADDTSASSGSVSNLSNFLFEAGTFATVSGQRIKPSKCKLWSTNPNLLPDLQALRLANKSLDIVQDVRFLGAQFGFHLGTPLDNRDALLLEISEQVRRVACLPLTAEEKGLLISSAAIPRAVHGCQLTPPDFGS